MFSAYIAAQRRKFEALPGGPYPGVDPAAAAELDSAVEALNNGSPILGDEGNGVYSYLRALAAVRAGDARTAVDEIRQGNAKPRLELSVAINPVASACSALQPITDLGRQVDTLIAADPSVAADLYDTAIKIAWAEPKSKINLLVSAGFVNAVLKADAIAARESNDVGRIRAATQSADRHRDWMTGTFKSIVGSRMFSMFDHIRFNRMAGVTNAEADAYFQQTLTDPAKIASFEYAAELAYRRERVSVERLLRRVPRGE